MGPKGLGLRGHSLVRREVQRMVRGVNPASASNKIVAQFILFIRNLSKSIFEEIFLELKPDLNPFL